MTSWLNVASEHSTLNLVQVEAEKGISARGSSLTWFVCIKFLFYFEGKLDEVYESLVNAHPNMTVYKKEEIPSRLHYKHNSRIQPVLAVADIGWEIVKNKTDPFLCKYSSFFS